MESISHLGLGRPDSVDGAKTSSRFQLRNYLFARGESSGADALLGTLSDMRGRHEPRTFLSWRYKLRTVTSSCN